jgi:hypothetical protein
MKPAGILLAVVLLGTVGVTGAMAECQIADAKLEEAILNKPELRGPANSQIVRDLRNLRDAALIALHRAHERLGHSVRLGALDRGGAGLEADVTSKALGVVCDVSGAVVGQPFDGRRQSIEPVVPLAAAGVSGRIDGDAIGRAGGSRFRVLRDLQRGARCDFPASVSTPTATPVRSATLSAC